MSKNTNIQNKNSKPNKRTNSNLIGVNNQLGKKILIK